MELRRPDDKLNSDDLRARAVRFSTLNALCKVLDFQPGDILEFDATAPEPEGDPLVTVAAKNGQTRSRARLLAVIADGF